MKPPIDSVSLVAGIVVTAFGMLMMLDQGGDLELSAGVIAAIAAAAFGLVLLVSGLIENR